MNLFEYERKVNSKNPKQLSTQDKLFNECMNINEQQRENAKTMAENYEDKRRRESNLIGESMNYSRSA